MSELAIQHLASGGIITNYSCSSRCRHCLYGCGPERSKDFISPERAAQNASIVRNLGCTSVHIGGGEPFLKPDHLLDAVKAVMSKGVGIDYIETNSSWFKSMDSAVSLLSELRQEGVGTLLISISPFHNEYIPFSKVRGVMEACQKTGISIFPWVTDFIQDLSHFDESTVHSLNEYEKAFGKDYLQTIPSRYWIHYGGRSLKTFAPLFQEHSTEEILNTSRGCQELTDVSHFHIDLYGNYVPGLCSGLSINAEDLGKSLSVKDYPILNALFKGGVRQLYETMVKDTGFKPDPQYVSKCHLCFHMRKHMSDRNAENHELQPEEFYVNV